MSQRTTATPATAPCGDLAPQLLPDIVQREEDGMWSIGWHDDAAGPFASRKHAVDVAARKEVAHVGTA
jgi:hypothetical protein